MRHVRMLGLCLTAAVAVAAFAATGPGEAMAATNCKRTQKEYENKYGEVTCETQKERATYEAFANCPFNAPPVGELYSLTACSWAESSYSAVFASKSEREQAEAEGGEPGAYHSEFTAGKVTVALKYPILLQGGIEINEETGEEAWVNPEDGLPAVQPVAQPTIPLTKGVDRALLAPSELQRYNYWVHTAKQTKTYATVEQAGMVGVSTEELLSEEGTAFSFPVKVKLSNGFLGESCYVGSSEHPVTVEFTTGTSGALHGFRGRISGENYGNVIGIHGDRLVSESFAVPGVEGCGVEGGADAAVDAALGLPSSTGNSSILNGTLRISGAESAKEGLEGR